jgi:tRNA nucleotidyltransferase (CCA-adding enzyme)
MHIILCHEQADFDGLASLLGAWLCAPGAVPVLPRRFNRNARNFLELYHTELPFVDPRALPPGAIEAVTLVDSQALPTLKGMGSRTTVEVVDHHPLHSGLPLNWKVTSEALGACSTLFVENIQKLGLALTPTQATLMLLGIYEDTGSLTYASVTPRDARAAAALLEQGASLQMLGEFLNPPLTGEQRRLFDLLLTSVESHPVQGTEVLVARASALDVSDEVSSVAHKLRDLLDPDVLLLVIETVEGVRLVARSTVDSVNVAAIAAHFGGGGHARAAAALVHPDTSAGEDAPAAMARVYKELLEYLPTAVHPRLTVGQIMSPRPRLLTPDSTVDEAARLMQRYGYEGYPVLSAEGRVLGLLTRRAVDRALGYKGQKIQLTAGSLMNAGEVSVRPGDSLERLQHLMTATGWGQVPVLDPRSGEVVGIVTRTDLVKNLSGDRSHLPGRVNLARKLEQALPPARLALLKMAAAEAHDRGLAVYIVGGFVRDLYLDRPSPDLDLVVEGDAVLLGAALASKYGGRVVSHRHFSTAKWNISAVRQRLAEHLLEPGEQDPAGLPATLDLVSARTEFYDYPSALPTVEHGSIKLDLHRRDFSINTMALRLDGSHYGELYDYWGGLKDLRKGSVRVLHSLSFVDDPTRMLRAVRFEQRFGFNIEERTLQLMREAHPLLENVSGERLRHELDLILGEEKRLNMLARLAELGLLNAIHPRLAFGEDERQALQRQPAGPPGQPFNLPARLGSLPSKLVLAYLLWLGQLEAEDAAAAAERLRFSGPALDALRQTCLLARGLPALAGLPPSAAAARLEGLNPFALYAASLLVPDPRLQEVLVEYLAHWKHVRPLVTSAILKARGIPPGPLYRKIFEDLRGAWLDGAVKNATDEEALLAEILRQPLPPDFGKRP